MNFRKKIAMDLGTASILVYVPGKGIVMQEPSIVAVNTYDNKIISVGNEAKKILGRTSDNITTIRPLKDGVVANFDATEKIIEYFLKKTVGKVMIRPDMLICVPSQISEVQRRAVIQAAKYAGAHNTYLIEEPIAAAIGAGIDIADEKGNLIVDIGGGTTDVAVISMGKIVKNKSMPIAGDEFDNKIKDFIQKKYKMLIGDASAEKIKIRVANAYSKDEGELYEVRGRNLINGLPMHIYISSSDIYRALSSTLDLIVRAVEEVIEETPPELVADIFERGIIMTGGGSLLKGLDKLLEEKIKVAVRVADGPITAVIRGTGKALNFIDDLEDEEDNFKKERRSTILARAK
ncbi:MAG: rod shape-determining protein [Finegoldia sp.]|nr:rod shape-determining protein [Finegoldia sp.]